MSFKDQQELPTEGQFVFLWSGINGVWSRTYHWIAGTLHIYSPGDGWESDNDTYRDLLSLVDDHVHAFIVLEEE